MPEVLPHFPAEGQKGFPVGEPVAHECPVQAQDHVEKEDIGCGEMDKAHRAKQEGLAGLLVGEQGWRIGNNEAGHRKHRYAKHVYPVEDPHREFPDIDAFKIPGNHDGSVLDLAAGEVVYL